MRPLLPLLLLAEPAAAVWPQPVSTELGDGARRQLVGDNFTCTASGDILTAACTRYEGYLRSRSFPVHSRLGVSATGTPLTQLVVTAADTTSEFTLRTNESYTLTVPEAGAAQLHAPHAIGALRGLETFFQLLEPSSPAIFTVPTPTRVRDAPRWPHRGLLLDTVTQHHSHSLLLAPQTAAAKQIVPMQGRHYYPVAFIKHIIEGMSMDKLSVLHWHITEILSFPLVVESVPQLADIAAFSPAAVYTHDDVAEVIAHARLHGVRVLPELDMPGHMTAWGTALPELGITMDCGTQHHIA